MSNKILFGLMASAAILLSACSGDVTEVTEVNETTGMQVLEKGEALPKCNSDSEGSMVYALDSSAAYVCINKKWKSLNGKDGEQGAKGDKGEQGEQGEKGDKGDKGEAGDAGSSCSMEALPDSSGFKVLCGGDSVGVVLNGATGEKGETGAKGDQGDPGEKGDKGEQGEKGNKGDAGPKGDMGVGCSLLDDGNGSVKVTCGEGDYATTTTLYKAVCGNVPYDPEHETCDGICGTTPFISTRYFCDTRDNQIYKFVTIGTQTWMAQNLNFKNTTCYNDDPANCEIDGEYSIDGYYYSEDVRLSDCPNGWHLPDTSDFRILIDAVGGEAVAGKMLKSTNGWKDANGKSGNGIDAYGFSAIPAGSYFIGSSGEKFSGRETNAYFLTNVRISGEHESNIYILSISNDSDRVTIGSTMCAYYNGNYRRSVRCIKD